MPDTGERNLVAQVRRSEENLSEREASGALRVAYDHTIFNVQLHGGISRYFAELIPRVAAYDGVEACVHMGLYINQYGLERHRGLMYRMKGMRRPNWRRGNTAALRVGNWMFARFAAKCKPSIYHATFYTELAPRLSAARVITVHDFIHERVLSVPSASMPGLKSSILNAAGLICVSENTKRDLIEFLGVDESKIRVVYHGNSLQGVVGGPRPVAEPYLLFVGGRYGYKGFFTLLKVFAASARLRSDFRLVAGGGGPLTPAELEQIESLGIADRIIQLPSLSDEALASVYAHAAAMVYPSLYEGFGLPLLEAMSQGCPVISSNTSCLPEVGGDAAVYFDPHNADELKQKLESVVYDTALCDALREKGRKRGGQFSWDRCARETLAFYQDLAGY
jgi:glycosyltransferase involved in cell wall biosynthesis